MCYSVMPSLPEHDVGHEAEETQENYESDEMM